MEVRMQLSPIAADLLLKLAATSFADRRNLFELRKSGNPTPKLEDNVVMKLPQCVPLKQAYDSQALSAWGFAVSRAERARKPTPET
jgi:hypothetical protein